DRRPRERGGELAPAARVPRRRRPGADPAAACRAGGRSRRGIFTARISEKPQPICDRNRMATVRRPSTLRPTTNRRRRGARARGGRKEQTMRRLLEIGGLVAGVVLVAFGIASLVIGINGHSTVNDSIKQEKIVGSPDMTPAAIKEEVAKSGLVNVKLPTCDVAGEP